MSVHIIINYVTSGSLNVRLQRNAGVRPEVEEVLPMTRMSEYGQWELWCDVSVADVGCEWRFRFDVVDGGTVVDEEMPWSYHSWLCCEDSSILVCRWNTSDGKAWRYSSAYTDCIFPLSDRVKSKSVPNTDAAVTLVIPDYLPPRSWHPAIVGSTEALGAWQPERALPLARVSSNRWQIGLSGISSGQMLEYKYILLSEEGKGVEWEDGENRIFTLPSSGEHFQQEELPLLLPEASGKISGVMIPLFSVRTHRSWGVGDFGDLKLMIDWAAEQGMNVVQLLPVGDTTRTNTWVDSYPYNGVSVYALHPIYADLNELAPLSDNRFSKIVEAERSRLNRLRQLDYDGVVKLKNEWLQRYFEAHKTELLADSGMLRFERENEDWLTAYSCYRVLQRLKGTSDFRRWGDLAVYDASRALAYIERHHREVERKMYVWIQYLLDQQLCEAHQYARSRGVVLKGDIPIGVSRDSATAWRWPQYFNFDSQAGAPPDYFSRHGQNWGFPTYNWDRLLTDGGCWWENRLKHMARYFDAYRIDHVLGFFRIWEIPCQLVFGTLGHFNPALPLTLKEIKDWGFEDDVKKYTVPNFSDEELKAIFGDGYGTLQIHYFTQDANGRWLLKPTFLSQRQILDETVAGPERDALMNCVADVLFIPARHEPGKFHPNIMGNKTVAYHRLSDSDKEAYDRLSSDFFYHRHDAFWTDKAIEKLKRVVHSTRMLPCAEDLGMIPQCMRTVLDRLHILSLEVESMPKYTWGRFSDVMKNPGLSVDTISTHDMPPMRLWWRTDRDAAQDYYNNVLHLNGEAPYDLPSSLCRCIAERHMKSPSLLCILAFQDWAATKEEWRSDCPEDERVNDPADAQHYWRYRMHRCVEDFRGENNLTR